MKIVQKFGFQQINCTKCNSLLEISVDDIVDDDTGQLGLHYQCPVCRKHVTLKTGDIPQTWLQELARREGR